MPDDLEDEESEEEEEELRRCFMAASSGTAPAAKEGEEEVTVEREAQKDRCAVCEALSVLLWLRNRGPTGRD